MTGRCTGRKEETPPLASAAAYSVTRNAAKLRSVLQEDLSGSLNWIDADSVIGQNGRTVPVDPELLSNVLDNSCKRCLGGHLETAQQNQRDKTDEKNEETSNSALWLSY